MKSPAFSQTVDTVDFNLLTRKENFEQIHGRKIRRRESRRNLVILTIVYGAFLALLLFLAF